MDRRTDDRGSFETGPSVVGPSDDEVDRTRGTSCLASWQWDLARDSLFVTPEISSILGWSRDGSLDMDSAIMTVHEDDREAFRAAVRTAATGVVTSLEHRVLLDAEKATVICTHLHPVFGDDRRVRALVGTVQEVPDQARPVHAQPAHDARFQSIVDNAFDAILESDDQGRVTYVSPSTTSLLGYELKDLGELRIGRQPLVADELRILHPDDLPLWTAYLSEMERRGMATAPRVRIREKTGDWHWVELRVRWYAGSTGPRRVTTFRDVAHQVEAERRAERLALERRRLIHQQLRARESDHRKFAHDLHDGPVQLLVTASMLLEASRDLNPTNPGSEFMDPAIEHVQTAVHELRRLMSNLRPAALDDLGLREALRNMAEACLAPTDIALTVQLDDLGSAVDDGIQIVLYRVAQEAITNVVRHAEASQLWLGLAVESERAILTVKDDGRGFDPAGLEPDATHGHRLGLVGMRERADLVDGTLDIRSASGQGTEVHLVVPLHAATETAETGAA